MTVSDHIGSYLFLRQRVSLSYVHVHSLQGTPRAITAVILIMACLLLRVQVGTRHASARGARRARAVASGRPRRRLFAIIEGLHHASSVWTRLWQQEVVLEDADAVPRGSVTAAHHLGPIILEVLHEA